MAVAADAVFIHIVRLGLYHTAAVPVFIVRGFGDILVGCRPGLRMVVGVDVAEPLLADGTICRLLAGCRPAVAVSVGGDDGSLGDDPKAIPANGVAGVALLGTGRFLFTSQIGAGRVQIVIIRVDFAVLDAAGVAPRPFMAVCGGIEGMLTDTAADRADAFLPHMIFPRIFHLTAAAPFALVPCVVAPLLFIPNRRCTVGMRTPIAIAVCVAADLADCAASTSCLAAGVRKQFSAGLAAP
mgnify:CR=1 FL=1